MLIALGVSAVVLLARLSGSLIFLELGLHDRLLHLQPIAASAPDRVVLIRIRENEIARYGHPLPDATLARAVNLVLAAEPRALGIDLYRDRPVGGGMEDLAHALRADPRVVVIEKLPERQEPGTRPPGYLAGTDRVGFSDLPVDPDGVVRRAFLFLWDERDELHVSFALRLALVHLRPQGISLVAHDASGHALGLGRASMLPLQTGDAAYVGVDDRGYQILLDERRGPASSTAFALDDLLEGRVPAEALRDRAVIIGTTAPSVGDSFLTPFAQGSGDRTRVYGIDLHARLVDQLLRQALDGDPMVQAPGPRIQAAALLALAYLGAALVLGAPSIRVWWAIGIAVPLLLLAAAWAGLGRSWWLPVLPPVLGFVASASLAGAHVLRAEQRDKALLRKIFARHVSKAVLEDLWRKRDQFMEAGHPRTQRMEISVLMADLQGYTAVSEKMEPVALLDWVNDFMSAMAHLVETSGGVIDDYWGDGLKANFSVPLPRSTEEEVSADARNAVSCALAMAREMEALNARWREHDLPTGRLRIGIHTGPVVVGYVGSAEHLKYTSVGDTVNLAARLESLDKEDFAAEVGVSARILVSESTRRHLAADAPVQCMGPRMVAGRSQPVEVFRVLAGPREE